MAFTPRAITRDEKLDHEWGHDSSKFLFSYNRALTASTSTLEIYHCLILNTSNRQCPGTTIERNFEVGTSLRVSFKVNGSTPLEPVCFNATAPSAGQEHEREIHNDDSDTYDSAVTSTAAGSTSTAAASPEDASQRQLLVTATRKGSPRRRTQAQERLLADQVSSITPHNETICEASLPVADDDLGVGEEGDADWTWGTDGATFALGKLSRIRLSSDVMLDGSWIALPWGLSTADGALNEITIAMGTFESRAMYSTLIFFEAPEIVEDRGRDNDTGKPRASADM